MKKIVKKSFGSSEGKTLPLIEEFFSIQGEGYHTGEAAWFIRLGGCNVGCSWCDTPLSWDPDLYPMVDTDSIVRNAVDSGTDSVVITGGEPLMWNLDYLCCQLKRNKIRTFIETSGVCQLSGKWDWICLSPKKNVPPGDKICRIADELKVIIEEQDDFEWAEKYRILVRKKCRLYLQPEWSRFETIIPEIINFVRKNQVWRISLQTHKYMHIP